MFNEDVNSSKHAMHSRAAFQTCDVIELTFICSNAATLTDLVPSFRENKITTSNYVQKVQRLR